MPFFRVRSYLNRRGLPAEQKKRLEFLESRFGCVVVDPGLYFRALRHRSKLIDENFSHSESYERLEFLGDAVLDLVATEILFERFPNQDEGFMTQLRSKLVKGDSLAVCAQKLDFPQVIEIGDRAKGQGIEFSTSVLSDIFEALVGALYIDRGYGAVRKFVESAFDEYLDIQATSTVEDNFKSLLMEFAQARRLKIPAYRVVEESGPPHNRIFSVEVYIGDVTCGKGTGRSKKNAEQEAARVGLEWMKTNADAITV